MIDPGDYDLIRGLMEQMLRERDQSQDRKAKARADADAFLRDLSRRDPRPEDRSPVTVVTTELPIQRLDFFADTSPQSSGSSSGSTGTTLAYPGVDGVYALKVSSSGAVVEWLKLDEVPLPDCSTGTTVMRNFLALPAP